MGVVLNYYFVLEGEFLLMIEIFDVEGRFVCVYFSEEGDFECCIFGNMDQWFFFEVSYFMIVKGVNQWVWDFCW